MFSIVFMCVHISPLLLLSWLMFYGIHFQWVASPPERCPCLLLYPLMTLSVPHAGGSEYGPLLSRCRLDLLGFLTKDSTPSFYLFILWRFLGLKWNIGLLKTIWRPRRNLKKLLCGIRTIIIATISWSGFFLEVFLISPTGLLAPLDDIRQL